MATRFASDKYANSYTANQFRDWAQFLHDLFLVAWVKTADTGQVTIASMAAATTTGQSMGYNIFRTNDGLTPVFIKLEYGSGASAGCPSIWVTVGTSSDGAGNINGTILLARTQINGGGTSSTQTQYCFGSVAAGRICFALFLSTTAYPFWFSLERRKDAALSDVNTGVIIDWGLATSGHRSLCAPFSGVIPVAETGLQFILTTVNPGIYSNVIPEGLRIPCLGPSEPPGLNVALCNAGDWGQFAEPTITINGTPVIYKQCGASISTLRASSSGAADPVTRLLLRYE